jgi:regulator of cell morphogenesis and NO signaling
MTLIDDKAYSAWTAMDGRWEAAASLRGAGLEVDSVLEDVAVGAALADGLDRIDATHATMTELVNHVEDDHHTYLRRELPRLQSLADRAVAAHQKEYPELVETHALFGVLKLDLEVHMLIEQRALFPQFRRLESTPAREHAQPFAVHDPIVFAELEHEDILALFDRLRSLTSTYAPPTGASAVHRALLAGLARLEANVRREIQEEEHLLFPRARVAEAVRLSEQTHPFE